MNLITETWRGLVRRKLWPVALLLVGALAAVPLLLAKEPVVEPAPANIAAVAADEDISTSYVTSAGDAELEGAEETTTKRRRTLGATKDPFEPAPLPKAKKKKKKATDASTTSTKDEDSSSSDSSSKETSAGGGTTAPTTAPVATATPTATPKPAPLNSIRVRFSKVEADGATAEEPKAATVTRLEVLPDDENPVLVYRGVEDGGKVAVFELTGSVTVEGDGECHPTPEDCQILKLRAGETEFVTVTDTGSETTDAQYQIDLIKINSRK
ncbi:hypothetical protein OJ998_31425 [Solirubrobacter taibaiensis]|nr:hypothetical protein [Solirubrobacter taibaiensis]